jgi:DNA polymerase V
MMPHGGKRPGAGRPRKEPKSHVYIPTVKLEAVADFLHHNGYNIPLYNSRVPAGIPTAGDGTVEEYVNLCQKLVPDSAHIFSVYASGDSMINAGIFDGDLLLVNSREEPRHRKIVIATIDGQQTVKRLHMENGYYTLVPENDNYRPIVITENMEFSIQGVVMSCIKVF